MPWGICCMKRSTEQGIQLDRELFVLGNLLPDYMPELILNPHFTLKCPARDPYLHRSPRGATDYQRGAAPAGSTRCVSASSATTLTDYFTFAHTPEFRLGLKQHGAYEQQLNDYFREHYTIEQSTPGQPSIRQLWQRARSG